MQLFLHQTHHTLGDFENILSHLQSSTSQKGLHLFPELYLTGYPLQDLCLQQSFIQKYQQLLKKLNQWNQKRASDPDQAALIGGLRYEFDQTRNLQHLYNTIYLLQAGKPFQSLYDKRLLPNYDIFDEKKYFTPGHQKTIWEFQEKRLGLLICEDMWASARSAFDPISEFKDQGLDAVINLSASPFHLGKHQKRLERAREISTFVQAPFIYVNRVGAEDEILFDGRSFMTSDHQHHEAPAFQADCLALSLNDNSAVTHQVLAQLSETPWEGLFLPRWDNSLPPQLSFLTSADCESLLPAIQFGLQEYLSKTHHQKIIVALSGGMDSALVLVLAKLCLKPNQELEAVYMPGHYSSELSFDLALKLCQNLGLKLKHAPIKFLHSTGRQVFQESFKEPLKGLADENIQSRLRMLLLFARANQTEALVLNTSNKSELAVGYSTLYGDSAGALSLLGDLYKTEVYQLAHYLNQHYGNLIPEAILSRPATAELRADQKDSDSLPPYQYLDAILEGILSYSYSPQELVEKGFEQKDVERVFKLYQSTEYKRFQFCPIIKLKNKSFGFGYRVPLCKQL